MPTNEEYYADIQDEIDKIIVHVSKQSLQPREGPSRATPRYKGEPPMWNRNSGAVYIVSIANRDAKEHRAGVVALAPYWIAARGIVDRLHEVATDEQIKTYLAGEKVKREEIQGAAARNRGVTSFNVVPPVLEVK